MDDGTGGFAQSGRRGSRVVGWFSLALLFLGGAWQLASGHGMSVTPVLLLALAAAGIALLAAGVIARSLMGSLVALIAVFSLAVWFFWLVYAAFMFVVSLEAVRPPPPGTQWFALVATALCIVSAVMLIADGMRTRVAMR